MKTFVVKVDNAAVVTTHEIQVEGDKAVARGAQLYKMVARGQLTQAEADAAYVQVYGPYVSWEWVESLQGELQRIVALPLEKALSGLLGLFSKVTHFVEQSNG